MRGGGEGRREEREFFFYFFLPNTVANDSQDFRAMMTRTSFPIFFFFSSLNLRFVFFNQSLFLILILFYNLVVQKCILI